MVKSCMIFLIARVGWTCWTIEFGLFSLIEPLYMQFNRHQQQFPSYSHFCPFGMWVYMLNQHSLLQVIIRLKLEYILLNPASGYECSFSACIKNKILFPKEKVAKSKTTCYIACATPIFSHSHTEDPAMRYPPIRRQYGFLVPRCFFF